MNAIATAKDAYVAATEACAAAAVHARTATELEAYRNACAHAGDAYRNAHCAANSIGDLEREDRVDAALDLLEDACRDYALRAGKRNAV